MTRPCPRKRRQRLRDELRRLAPEVTGEPLPQDMKHGQRIVTLNPDVVASDVQEFLELLNSARTLEPADAIRAYEAALALYRGDLLDAARYGFFLESTGARTRPRICRQARGLLPLPGRWRGRSRLRQGFRASWSSLHGPPQRLASHAKHIWRGSDGAGTHFPILLTTAQL